jgi:hypothetical protein
MRVGRRGDVVPEGEDGRHIGFAGGDESGALLDDVVKLERGAAVRGKRFEGGVRGRSGVEQRQHMGDARGLEGADFGEAADGVADGELDGDAPSSRS